METKSELSQKVYAFTLLLIAHDPALAPRVLQRSLTAVEARSWCVQFAACGQYQRAKVLVPSGAVIYEADAHSRCLHASPNPDPVEREVYLTLLNTPPAPTDAYTVRIDNNQRRLLCAALLASGSLWTDPADRDEAAELADMLSSAMSPTVLNDFTA